MMDEEKTISYYYLLEGRVGNSLKINTVQYLDWKWVEGWLVIHTNTRTSFNNGSLFLLINPFVPPLTLSQPVFSLIHSRKKDEKRRNVNESLKHWWFFLPFLCFFLSPHPSSSFFFFLPAQSTILFQIFAATSECCCLSLPFHSLSFLLFLKFIFFFHILPTLSLSFSASSCNKLSILGRKCIGKEERRWKGWLDSLTQFASWSRNFYI